MYLYAAKLDRIIDADTVSLVIDLGFHLTITETFRLKGLNAPERNTAAGKAATLFVGQWFAKQASVLIQSSKPLQ